VTGAFLEFHDVELELDDGSFVIRLLKDVPPFQASARFEGSWVRADGLILTALALPAQARPGNGSP
jgi:hypothetical protein